ncbi:ribose-phosphate pyrophosphokinase, partial [human gut metagenome]
MLLSSLRREKLTEYLLLLQFGLFTNGLERFDEAYEQGLIYRIMTTNSIYQSPELLKREWYINVDITKFTATFIDRLNHDASISDLLNPIEKL